MSVDPKMSKILDIEPNLVIKGLLINTKYGTKIIMVNI